MDAIEENAFASPQLQNIVALSFYDQYSRNIRYQPGFLNNLNALHLFALECVSFQTTDGRFLAPIKTTLEYLHLTNASTLRSLHNMFVGEPFVRLKRIIVIQSYPIIDITQQTFGPLPSIETLELVSCGILSIAAGTFDEMASTLQTLSLRLNYLQTLPPMLFHLLPANMHLNLEGNPWKCQCIILELNARYRFLESEFHRRCDWERCGRTVEDLNYNLRTQRSCAYHPNAAALYATQPKFSMKFPQNFTRNLVEISSRQLNAKWENVLKIFVVVLLIRSSTYENDFDSKCYICQRQHIPILISLQELGDRTQPQIMYIMNTARYVWPLNIMPIRQLNIVDGWLLDEHRHFAIILFLLSLLIGFGFGTLSGLFLLCRYPTLIKNGKRVVVLRNRKIGGIQRKTQVFIMPKNWRPPALPEMREDGKQ